MAEKTERKTTTKRKVNLVSSHSDNENQNEGPLAAYTLEGSAILDLYKNKGIPSFMRYFPKEGEQLIEEDIYIPDVD